MNTHPVNRIVSGGQTGIDQLGLEVGRCLGITTGGIAPKGYITENGPDLRLRDYGLREHPLATYPPRTRANVKQSDGTVLLGVLAGGTKLTLTVCVEEGKPYCVNPTADQLRQWLVTNQISVLNVAGSRGSKLSDEKKEHYRQVLLGALNQLPILAADLPG